MEKENKTDFESCKNMIYKMALNAYNKNRYNRPDVQFDDVHSEAMLIYAMCLKNYDSSKGMKFTTHLYTNLQGRLADYYRCTLKPITHYEDYNRYDNTQHLEKRYEDYIIDEREDNGDYFLEIAEKKLSYEGFQVLKYILSEDWISKKNKNKPSIKSIMKKFGYTSIIVESIMGELREFWKETGCSIAA